ncbi:hypothetical protein SPB21_04355 [Leptothoe sp. ISB3NOV94-8A]|nr:hypothetical protein [Leptothoe sp. LEGE 181152]
MPDRKGLGALNSNDHLILVKANIDEVGFALKKIRNCGLHQQNVYGKDITLGNRACCYSIQLTGHGWSALQYIKVAPVLAIFNREDAQAISRFLSSEAVFFEFSDTGTYLNYFYYRLGALLERLEYVEISNKAYYEFYSEYRSLGFDVTRDDAFLVANDFFYNKGIYPIEITWKGIGPFVAGDNVLFEFTRLDIKDVVQADYFEI